MKSEHMIRQLCRISLRSCMLPLRACSRLTAASC